MDLRALCQSYRPALVRITVQTPMGDLSTGTAFHIGDGWLVTAAHVLRDGVVQEVVSEYASVALTVQSVIFNKDDRIDLALMKTDLDLSHYLHMTTIHGSPKGFVQTDHIEIGGHLDDWLGDELVLSKVLLMGYPPVPFSQLAVLLASEGEVNAVVDKYSGPHPHFIISCSARGGFSGGPVLSEYGFLLGVLVESLVMDGKDEETGYSSAISIEPLLVMLHDNGIYPGKNRQVVEALIAGIDNGFGKPSWRMRRMWFIEKSILKIRILIRRHKRM
ncbi:S1 family peptidase [Dyella jiangningensis]|uniref:Serine protease n=1 Tax=Dyella jiangningensis TaxID=1379159 RepID=A0A328P2D7_9GAMM|nr:serine protease [Dyella jiangningensis]RAO76330.1 serine protease [Dyella jiangningensis]CUI28102.1 V8-like Glu-specific endopeptidase [Achromobacter xylosoxidans]CUI47404.1 V8-like Glu-specific endopeptidase [Achromobacter xylosoxidans]